MAPTPTETALRIIQRQARGKPGFVAQQDSDVQAEYKRLLKDDRRLKNIVQQGRAYARAGTTTRFDRNLPTKAELEAGQSLPSDIRSRGVTRSEVFSSQSLPQDIRTRNVSAQEVQASQSLPRSVQNQSMSSSRQSLPSRQAASVQAVSNDPTIASRILSQKVQRLDNTRAQIRRQGPFETLSQVLPRAAGGLIQRSPLRDSKISGGGQEIPQRRTISNQPTAGDVKTARTEIKVKDLVEETTALAQFAIPYVGEALFLGTLVEKPILNPQQFKEEFKNNPVQTSVLYAAGLISVAGGVSRALNRIERKALDESIKKAKINFQAIADEDTINILSTMRVNNKPFLTRAQLKNVAQDDISTFSKGKEVQLTRKQKNKIEMTIRDTMVESRSLENAKARRIMKVSDDFLPDKPKGIDVFLTKEIPGQSFLSKGVSRDERRIVFDARKGFNIKDGQLVFLGKSVEAEKVAPNLVKGQVVGVISPTETENLFRVLAGDARLRIYKSGGVSYVFDPRISGYLRIKNTGGLAGGESRQIIVRRLKLSLPAITQQLQKKARRAFAPTVRKLNKSDKLSTITVKSSKGIGVSTTARPSVGLKSTELIEVKRPTIVGGSGARSEFAGKGTYELSEGGQAVPFKNRVASPLSRTGRVSRLDVRNGLRVKVRQASGLKSVSELASASKEKQVPLIRTRNTLSNAQRSNVRLRYAQASSQVQRQQQRPRTRQTSRPQPPKPRLRFAPLGLLRVKPPRNKVPKLRPTYSGKFDVFTRKGRRLNPLPLSEKAARGLGQLKTDVGIKASFFIRKTNRPGFRASPGLERQASRTAYKFRPSKRTPGLIVEKNRFRLEKRGRTSEVREIQRAKAFGGRRFK